MVITRVSVVAAISVIGASLTVAAPAAAEPPSAPSISEVATDVAGHVTGTVTTTEPFVRVSLDGAFDAAAALPTTEGATSFDLPTWGFGPGSQVSAVACPTEEWDQEACSAAASEAFDVHDVVPEVTWFTDPTIGPADPAPEITVTDPDGGGVLVATYHTTGNQHLATDIPAGVPTALDISEADRATGYVQLTRCSSDKAHCTAFDPDQQTPLHVIRTLQVSPVGSIPVMTSVADSSFAFRTNVTGAATVSWHLESAEAPGETVPGTESTDERTIVDFTGIAPITIPRGTVLDGTYQVVGTIDLDSPHYGLFADVPFTRGPLTVDKTGPALTSITRSAAVVYPNIATAKRPGVTLFTISGPGLADAASAEMLDAGGNAVAYPGLDVHSDGTATASWSGYWSSDGKPHAGTYTFVVYDSRGNPSSVTATVTISTARLVTKTWTRILTARNSLVDQYVGRCSTLRRPALNRSWPGSLGFYANTRCARQTWRASAASTVHGVIVPRAERYVDVHVDAYGGAARARPSSRSILRYLTRNGDWVSQRTNTRAVGWHRGATRGATALVFTNRALYWGFATAFRDKYDVHKFRVVLRYQVLG